MTADEAQSLLAACAYLGSHEMERLLLHAGIREVRLFRSQTADTYEFLFEDGTKGAFKSIEGNDKPVTAAYNHTPASALLSDVAAWLVARGLGFEHLIQGVAVVVCSASDVSIGTLQPWFPSELGRAGWEDAADLRKAAVFDALIAQQDRNATNFVYDPERDELSLFDNSFSFALPGHCQGASELLCVAHGRDPNLSIEEGGRIERFLNSEERQALGRILQADRRKRLEERAHLMLRKRKLLAPGQF